MSYATYIPCARSLLPQHTLPLDWVSRYADPMIRTSVLQYLGRYLGRLVQVSRTWTVISSPHSLLKYTLQFGMDWYGWTSSDSVQGSKRVVP